MKIDGLSVSHNVPLFHISS